MQRPPSERGSADDIHRHSPREGGLDGLHIASECRLVQRCPVAGDSPEGESIIRGPGARPEEDPDEGGARTGKQRDEQHDGRPPRGVPRAGPAGGVAGPALGWSGGGLSGSPETQEP